jgi:bifunctional non-homologous end joining protein LigD
VLGLYQQGKLVWTGNVGTGFDEQLLESVHGRLQPLASPRCPFEFIDKEMPKDVTWVRPELVCECRFSNWTLDGRLRAPVFLGLRADIDPAECVREATAAEPTAEGPAAAAPAPRETLLDPTKTEVALTIEGRRLKFTNLNKPYWPKEGILKRDLIEYYDAVAALIVPHLRDRPLSLKRYPDGIEGEFFFQKDATTASFPDWVRTEPVYSEHNRGAIQLVVCDDRATLLFLANLGCIDHNPHMGRVGSLENPDFILIDLDPQDCPYSKIVEAAQLVRRKLDAVGLEGYPKTTGGDGMHIYVPVEPIYLYEQTRAFAEILARLVAAERPDLFTTPRPVAKRERGKVYFDYAQNASGKTISAPYVVRAYAGAPVATPLHWREVTASLSPLHFHMRNAVARFTRVGDLFAPVLNRAQRLEEALLKVEPLVRGQVK